jgi:tetratricopeptide (TPR) repeat protein
MHVRLVRAVDREDQRRRGVLDPGPLEIGRVQTAVVLAALDEAIPDLDKGVPEASIRWFEKALKLPNLDEEGRTALHYELASAYEAAQNKRAALAHFMEVYGSNIDYRDVAERIKALKS